MTIDSYRVVKADVDEFVHELQAAVHILTIGSHYSTCSECARIPATRA